MKKRIGLLAVLLCFCAIFALVSCGPLTDEPDNTKASRTEATEMPTGHVTESDSETESGTKEPPATDPTDSEDDRYWTENY